ncbi:MAG: class I SAM-dependent methyltransferase [Candidatus Velthaea sp.]
MKETERFSERADDYATSRPGYGHDVVAFVLAGSGAVPLVADLGVGTGIAARIMAAYSARVIAIEQNARMRAQMPPHARIEVRDACAERTGLDDHAVDVATAFQAFHWFASDETLAEIRRIVRPRGSASLVANERDERDPTAAAYGDIFRRFAVDDTEERRQRAIDVFKRLPGTPTVREFTNSQTLDRAGLQRRTSSASYLPREGPVAEDLRREVDTLFFDHAKDGFVHIALRTIVVRVDLP